MLGESDLGCPALLCEPFGQELADDRCVNRLQKGWNRSAGADTSSTWPQEQHRFYEMWGPSDSEETAIAGGHDRFAYEH